MFNRLPALFCVVLMLFFAIPAIAHAEVGWCSWYANEHGQFRMANGKHFYPDRISCAHKTIKLGTRIRVTNLATGRSIVCPVLDRGPYVRGRIVDLSRGAARALGVGGTARVRIEVLR